MWPAFLMHFVVVIVEKQEQNFEERKKKNFQKEWDVVQDVSGNRMQ